MMRCLHVGVALLVAVVSHSAILWAMVRLNQTKIQPPKRSVRRAKPLPILRPPRPLQRIRTTRMNRPTLRTAPSILPALRLSSPVALPNFADAKQAADTSLGLLHPGSRNTGAKALGKNLILTEDLVDVSPKILFQVPPTYPPSAEIRHIEGSVVMRILVDQRGQVERVTVIRSKPPGVFDAAAIQAAYQWRFKPAIFQGRPTRVWVRKPLSFKLE